MLLLSSLGLSQVYLCVCVLTFNQRIVPFNFANKTKGCSLLLVLSSFLAALVLPLSPSSSICCPLLLPIKCSSWLSLHVSLFPFPAFPGFKFLLAHTWQMLCLCFLLARCSVKKHLNSRLWLSGRGLQSTGAPLRLKWAVWRIERRPSSRKMCSASF